MRKGGGAMASFGPPLTDRTVPESLRGSRNRKLPHGGATSNKVAGQNREAAPERTLMTRFRHVYAGRGGWYGYSNGPSGPVTLHNAPFLAPRHRKELLRQAAQIADRSIKRQGGANRLRRLGSPLHRYPLQATDDHPTCNYAQTFPFGNQSNVKESVDTRLSGLETENNIFSSDGDNHILDQQEEFKRAFNHDTSETVAVGQGARSSGSCASEPGGEDGLATQRSCSVQGAETGRQPFEVASPPPRQASPPPDAGNLEGADEARRYRKAQLFSRMSQEAQFAISETRREMRRAEERGHGDKGRTGSDTHREAELSRANEELTKFAHTLAAGANITDDSASSSDGAPQEVASPAPPCARSSSRANSGVTAGGSRATRPRTKLPNITANSPAYNPADTRNTNLPGIGNYKIVPKLSCAREQTFEITPPGYDSRYNVRRRDLDVEDETPVEIRARAVEKCSVWLEKYH